MAGKGSKWRETNFDNYYNNFDKIKFPPKEPVDNRKTESNNRGDASKHNIKEQQSDPDGRHPQHHESS